MIRHSYLGEKVGNAGNYACATHSKGRGEPVTLSCQGAELLRLECGSDAGHLGNTTTSELHTNNVRVVAQGL